MSDLDELGQVAAGGGQYRPGRRLAVRSSEDGPLSRGLLMAVGAAPVLIIVLIFANWMTYQIAKREAKAEIEEAQRAASVEMRQATREIDRVLSRKAP